MAGLLCCVIQSHLSRGQCCPPPSQHLPSSPPSSWAPHHHHATHPTPLHITRNHPSPDSPVCCRAATDQPCRVSVARARYRYRYTRRYGCHVNIVTPGAARLTQSSSCPGRQVMNGCSVSVARPATAAAIVGRMKRR